MTDIEQVSASKLLPKNIMHHLLILAMALVLSLLKTLTLSCWTLDTYFFINTNSSLVVKVL